MRKGRKWLTVIAAVMSLSLVAAACGGDDDDGGATGSENLTGTVIVSGSSTVQPITNLVAELFNEEVAAMWPSRSTGPGRATASSCSATARPTSRTPSRAIEQEEIDACGENGIEYIELEVAFDGITVMTNPANSAVEWPEPRGPLRPDGSAVGGFTSWPTPTTWRPRSAGPAASPTPRSRSRRRARSLERMTPSSTSPGSRSGVEQGLSEDDAAAMRKDYQASPDDNVIISAMEGSDTASGTSDSHSRSKRATP